MISFKTSRPRLPYRWLDTQFLIIDHHHQNKDVCGLGCVMKTCFWWKESCSICSGIIRGLLWNQSGGICSRSSAVSSATGHCTHRSISVLQFFANEPKTFFLRKKIKEEFFWQKKSEDADLRSMCGKRTRNRNRSCTLGKFKLTQIQKMQVPNFKNLSFQWLCLLGWPDGQLGIHKRQNWKFIYCWRCTGGLI